LKEKSIRKDKRIFGLDLMRTIAILMVLFSHLLLFSPSQNLITVQLAPLFGFLGVETFLVLSGFLIGNKIYARMVLQDKFSWTEALQTLKQRGWRTLPNYFLALLIAIIIGFWFQYSEDNLWKYFFLVQNFTSPMPLFFSESWSITIGFFGNVILISGMFLVINRFHFKNKSKAFLIGIVFIIMISLVWKLVYYLTNSTTTLLQWNTNLKAVVIYRLDSFFIGALCSWICFNATNIWKKHKSIFLCFGLLLMGLLFVGVGYFQLLIDSNPFFWDVLYLPLTSIAIAFLLPTFSQCNFEGVLKNSITFISKISFAVYLIHYSIILQLMSHFLVPKLYTTTEFCFFSICYLVITLLFGFIFYHFYERPLSNRSIKN
jgi:peptidoglycan/LPS O-acetylase OafA/YrhL